MAEHLAVLLERLEAAWVEPERASVESARRVLDERQEILGLIQEADITGLSPETRHDLAQRLRRIRERDQRLRMALDNQRNSLEKHLDGVLHARKAARSYRPSESDGERGPERVA